MFMLCVSSFFLFYCNLFNSRVFLSFATSSWNPRLLFISSFFYVSFCFIYGSESCWLSISIMYAMCASLESVSSALISAAIACEWLKMPFGKTIKTYTHKDKHTQNAQKQKQKQKKKKRITRAKPKRNFLLKHADDQQSQTKN